MVCLKLTLLSLLFAAPGLLVSGETVITCDGDVQRLSCDTGLISVTSTIYGRTDKKTCSPPPARLKVDNTSCSLSVSTIADRCNGLRVCEINTKLLGTSDPCKGTYKYYNTAYKCIGGRVAVVCEHGYRTLDCGTNYNIQIINANFGRADSVTCSNGFNNYHNDDSTPKTNCYAPNTLSTVASLCNGKQSCTVEASSSIFSPLPPPCKATSKYLTVSYTCIPATYSVVACEGDSASLKCASGSINIISAKFGRTDSTQCSSGRPASQLSNTNCLAPKAMSQIQTSCQGQSSCSVPSTNSYFLGDPCVGTYKYTEIVYSCVSVNI